MKFKNQAQDMDHKTLLRMLHLYLDERFNGRINVTGRSAIVNLIQTMLNNNLKLDETMSAWEVYYTLFELHQETNVPAKRRSPKFMHRQIDGFFTGTYGRYYNRLDIIRFYTEVGGKEAEDLIKQRKERMMMNERA